MATKSFTIEVDTAMLLAITAARLAYNKSLPQTVDGPVDEFGIPTQLSNPALITSDEEYLQQRWGVDAIQGYYDTQQAAFRIPTGEWLQRWTAVEKKQIRAIGAGLVEGLDVTTAQQVQAWLDLLDASPFVNLGDQVVVDGVPVVCALLELTGVMEQGQAVVRAAAITALNI